MLSITVLIKFLVQVTRSLLHIYTEILFFFLNIQLSKKQQLFC